MGPIGDDDLSGFFLRPQSLEPVQKQLRWPRRGLRGPWHGRSSKGFQGGFRGPLTKPEGPQRDLGGPQLELEWS